MSDDNGQKIYENLTQARARMASWLKSKGSSIYDDAKISGRIQAGGGGDRISYVSVTFTAEPFEHAHIEFAADEYLTNNRIFSMTVDDYMVRNYYIPDQSFPYASEAFHEKLMNEAVRISMRNMFLLYKKSKSEPDWVEEYKKNLDELIVKRIQKT
jgi:hypothetical protein